MKQLPLLCSLLLVLGCGEPASVHDSGAHERISVSALSGETEVLVSFTPLVVGKQTELEIHLSALRPEISPLSGAFLTVSLVLDKQGIRNKASEHSMPGVYAVVLKPQSAGKGSLIVDVQRKGQVQRFIMSDIMVHKDHKEVENFRADVQNDHSIYLEKRDIWKAGLSTEWVTKMPLENVVKASGQIIAAPGQEITVASPAAGVVRFASGNFTQGAPVKGRQALFVITGGDMNAEGNIDIDIRQAALELQVAQDEYSRAKQLIEEQLITKDKYQQAFLHYQNSRIKLAHLQKNYSRGGKQLSAPVQGFIKELLVQQGQYVSPGQPLATITKNQKVLLQVNVPLNEAKHIKEWQHARFVLQGGSPVYDTRDFNGRVTGKAISLQEPSSWFPLYFEMDHHPLWIPGSYTEVYLTMGVLTNVLAIPHEALLEEQGQHYVFIQTGAETFEKREVILGRSDGKRREIISGVKEGERLVVKGVRHLKLASTINAGNIHEHAH